MEKDNKSTESEESVKWIEDRMESDREDETGAPKLAIEYRNRQYASIKFHGREVMGVTKFSFNVDAANPNNTSLSIEVSPDEFLYWLKRHPLR